MVIYFRRCKRLAYIIYICPVHKTVSLAVRYSDCYRSTMGPSDSERDCPSSRRDSDTPQIPRAPRLDIIAPSGDSESGGSHSPSPRASRRRQVS